MKEYKIVGIDLAKTQFHLVAFDENRQVVMKKGIRRTDFLTKLDTLFPRPQTFAFEACGGANHLAQYLLAKEHQVVMLKPKDVKAYAKSRQKNDSNDALAIAKAGLDPDLKHVVPKTPQQQEVCYLHKIRQQVISQRIQKSNALQTSLQEMGFVVVCGKSRFAQGAADYVHQAYEQGFISSVMYEEMNIECEAIVELMSREKALDNKIIAQNKQCQEAQRLETIPGIGPINASLLSNKSKQGYKDAKEFAASLGLVPKQYTTGGVIKLGGITKQGDRYARTMLIQAGRTIVMRTFKPNVPEDRLYRYAQRLRGTGKHFNVICVAVANKLARIVYACATQGVSYMNQAE